MLGDAWVSLGVIVSGGNVDAKRYAEFLSRGL
jgi:threonine dehydratase